MNSKTKARKLSKKENVQLRLSLLYTYWIASDRVEPDVNMQMAEAYLKMNRLIEKHL